jgi:hypothetical protein
MNVRFHRLAVDEIDHEVDYYESRQAGLGSELEDEIDAVPTSSSAFPKQPKRGRAAPTGGLRFWSGFRSRCRIRSWATTS